MDLPRNKIIIIAAPSGAGKTSIVRYLLEKMPDQLVFSVSCTTRAPRNSETNGKEYYFIPVEEFEKKISEGAFAEWEMVYPGKYYGTPVSELERIWQLGKTPLLDIDVKGGINIRNQFPQSLAIFIEPPSLEELSRRLQARGTETPESLAARINKASSEMSYKYAFDQVILNENLEKACTETEKLVRTFLQAPAI
ncbi:MAG: guanylate kinase [Bacteroidetes bacterium]|nr:guanylate kinase [Bacteroidota bacterium]